MNTVAHDTYTLQPHSLIIIRVVHCVLGIGAKLGYHQVYMYPVFVMVEAADA